MDELIKYYKNQAETQPEPSLTAAASPAYAALSGNAARKTSRRNVIKIATAAPALCVLITVSAAAAASTEFREAAKRFGRIIITHTAGTDAAYEGASAYKDGEGCLPDGWITPDGITGVAAEISALPMGEKLRGYLSENPKEPENGNSYVEYRFEGFTAVWQAAEFFGIPVSANALPEDDKLTSLISVLTVQTQHPEEEDWLPETSPSYADAYGKISAVYELQAGDGAPVSVNLQMSFFYGNESGAFAWNSVYHNYDENAAIVYMSPANGVEAHIYLDPNDPRDTARFIVGGVDCQLQTAGLSAERSLEIMQRIIDAFEP